MKKLLLALLLSIGLVNAIGVIDRLEAALKSEDRATLEPFFYDTFTFETSYDHDGDANEAIDWILNRTIHGPFESLIMSENENSYEVDAKFYDTDLQLLLSLNKTTELIYVGSLQTHKEVVEGSTTTTSAPAPVITPQQWYLELLQALREKSKEALSSLIGSTYFSHMTRERILSILLKDYDTIKLIKRNETDFYVRITYVNEINTFFILANYDDQNGVSIRQIQFVNTAATKTTTTTSTLAPSTFAPGRPTRKWLSDLVEATYYKNRERVLELLGNEYSSSSSQEKILDYLLYHRIDQVRKELAIIYFYVELEFDDRTFMRISGRANKTVATVEYITLRHAQITTTTTTTTSTLAPSTTTTALRPITTIDFFFYKLKNAVQSKNKSLILQLLGKKYLTFLTEERILNILLSENGHLNLTKRTMKSFELVFDSENQQNLRILGKKSNTIIVTYIGLVNRPSTTTTPAPVTTPVEFYNALAKAIREQDKARIKELLGTTYMSILTEGQIIDKLLSKSHLLGRIQQLNSDAFDVIFEYDNDQTLRIRCNIRSHHVRVELIRLINNKPSTTTTIPTTTSVYSVSTPKEFHTELVDAIRRHNRARVLALLGNEYKSELSEDRIISILFRNTDYDHFENGTDGQFDVIFDYAGGHSLVIRGNSALNHVTIKCIKYTASTLIWLPMRKNQYQLEIVKAAREKNITRVSELIGNDFKSKLKREEIIEILTSDFLNTTSIIGAYAFSVTFEYKDGTTLEVIGKETVPGVRCTEIRRYKTYGFITTPAPTTTGPLARSPRAFYVALLQAIRKKDQVAILELIGKTYKSLLTEEQILEKLLSKYIRPDIVIIPNFIFKVSFEYPDGSILSLYGKSDNTNEARITLIALENDKSATKTTTTSAPGTTPCSISRQQKLLAKFHKTMGEWEASIALNDSNHLNSLIDDNFKMIHDKEGTESNKARLVRALFEGEFRFYTPQDNLQVEIESGLIKIKGQSKKYDATLWFREEEKALILVKAYYDKDVFKRKNALGFY